jgi:DNA-binding response OmpR family regulator
MSAPIQPIQLNDEDVAYLLTLLRNATQPMTTQQLIDALRRQSEQSQG